MAAGLGLAGAAVAFSWSRTGAGAPGQSAPGGLRGLDHPFRLYDETAPGNLPMPKDARQYEGWPDFREVKTHDDENGVAHVFAIGDWGAVLPNHVTFKGVPGLDDREQFVVANAMKGRAQWAKPAYVLNVGDNFYMGGITMDCNEPMSAVWGKPKSDFSSGWQSIYNELAEIPWLSVLGNHDYGGWQFNQGWPQQIAYSFVNHNWIMPARYFMKNIKHSNFDVDYFMLDTNHFDAKPPPTDGDHNICSQWHNPGGASCAAHGGMKDVWDCQGWFNGNWDWQKQWFEDKLSHSEARWKIVVTHFPCGYEADFFTSMRDKWGLDLLVTGHRHQQELWKPNTKSNYVRHFMEVNKLGDMPCFVTGGGGGITAQKFHDADYGEDLQWYGFFDLTMHRDWMKMELVGNDGVVHGSYSIQPSAIRTGRTFTTTSTSTMTSSTSTVSSTTSSTSTTMTNTTTSTTHTSTSSIPDWYLPLMPGWKPPTPPPIVYEMPEMPTFAPYVMPEMPTYAPYVPPEMPTALPTLGIDDVSPMSRASELGVEDATDAVAQKAPKHHKRRHEEPAATEAPGAAPEQQEPHYEDVLSEVLATQDDTKQDQQEPTESPQGLMPAPWLASDSQFGLSGEDEPQAPVAEPVADTSVVDPNTIRRAKSDDQVVFKKK